MQKPPLNAVGREFGHEQMAFLVLPIKAETIVREIHKGQNGKSFLGAVIVLWMCKKNSGIILHASEHDYQLLAHFVKMYAPQNGWVWPTELKTVGPSENFGGLVENFGGLSENFGRHKLGKVF